MSGMKKMKFVWVLVILLCVLACDTQKKAFDRPTESKVTRDPDSVYGNKGSQTDQAGGESLEIRDEQIPTANYDQVEGQVIDLEASQAAAAGWNWEPVYFEFDSSNLTAEAEARLKQYAEILKAQSKVRVLLEGHADSRGTENYNIALGERRAETVKTYLRDLGVNAAQLDTISYGEMQPLETQENEQAWSRNRRVAFAFK